tara:strand:+ start:341 stop:1291 length:951 start_codon:yes stop_codon:yes gene_type:complete
MKNICIIGLGKIGLRHLESLINSKKKINFYLNDINILKFNINKFFKNKNNFIISKNIDFDVKYFDYVIISTNSDIRKNILLELLKKYKINKILLEKIAFCHPRHYEIASNIINSTNTKCYINYPRNFLSDYRNIKKKINLKKKTKIEIIGNNWGLASNSFHFVSLFSYLTNAKNILIKNNELSKPFQSKRRGFFEFTGYINFQNEKKDKLILIDKGHHNNKQNYIKITNNKLEYLIYESQNKLIIYNTLNKKILLTKKFKMTPQSKLTKNYLETKNAYKLKDNKFDKNYKNDLILIRFFIKQFKKFNKNINYCPIT